MVDKKKDTAYNNICGVTPKGKKQEKKSKSKKIYVKRGKKTEDLCRKITSPKFKKVCQRIRKLFYS